MAAHLSELLDRVRASSGPDRELDYLIAEATGTMKGRSAPVTSSLDAAVTLCERVLPGWSWTVQKRDPLLGKNTVGGGHVHNGKVDMEYRGADDFAATPAIALVAAILSALIAKGGPHD